MEFTEDDWLKQYIMMNTENRMNAKNDFEKDFFKFMNNSVFGKTMENVRNQTDIRLVTSESKRIKLVSEPNYHTTKWFSENLLAIEMKKSILDISKTVLYEFWYDYMKKKYDDSNLKLCYMDTNSFVMKIKTNDFYKDISKDVNKWFDTSNFDQKDNILLEVGVNKKIIGKFKDELGGKVMSEFCALRPKSYSYKIDNSNIEVKKAKGTKNVLLKKISYTRITKIHCLKMKK